MKFSAKSRRNLATCHADLRHVFNKVIKSVDCTIIEGIRTLETQKEYVRTGKSKTMDSRHLRHCDGFSHAVDVVVYPIDWNDSERNYAFAFYVKGVADTLGIKIRIGADWDGDFDLKDQTFNDLIHFELVGK